MRKFLYIAVLAMAVIGLWVDSGNALRREFNSGEKANSSLEITNSRGEHVGILKTALGDQYGNIHFAVLSIRDENKVLKDVAVPISTFSKNAEGNIILNLDKKLLASAPEFHPSDLNDLHYVQKVYRYYGWTPPWLAEEGPEK